MKFLEVTSTYINLVSVHLSLCSDVRAYVGDQRSIYARVPGFVFERADVYASMLESRALQ